MSDLKAQIAATGRELTGMHLIYMGRTLEDKESIKDTVEAESSIYLLCVPEEFSLTQEIAKQLEATVQATQASQVDERRASISPTKQRRKDGKEEELDGQALGEEAAASQELDGQALGEEAAASQEAPPATPPGKAEKRAVRRLKKGLVNKEAKKKRGKGKKSAKAEEEAEKEEDAPPSTAAISLDSVNERVDNLVHVVSNQQKSISSLERLTHESSCCVFGLGAYETAHRQQVLELFLEQWEVGRRSDILRVVSKSSATIVTFRTSSTCVSILKRAKSALRTWGNEFSHPWGSCTMSWSFALGIGEQAKAHLLGDVKDIIAEECSETLLLRPESGQLVKVTEDGLITVCYIQMDGEGWDIAVSDPYVDTVCAQMPYSFAGIALRVKKSVQGKGKGKGKHKYKQANDPMEEDGGEERPKGKGKDKGKEKGRGKKGKGKGKGKGKDKGVYGGTDGYKGGQEEKGVYGGEDGYKGGKDKEAYGGKRGYKGGKADKGVYGGKGGYFGGKGGKGGFYTGFEDEAYPEYGAGGAFPPPYDQEDWHAPPAWGDSW